MNSNNVQSLLDAANQYQIEPVKKMCVDFLKEQVDASNCLGKKSDSYLKKNKTFNVYFSKKQTNCGYNYPHLILKTRSLEIFLVIHLKSLGKYMLTWAAMSSSNTVSIISKI